MKTIIFSPVQSFKTFINDLTFNNFIVSLIVLTIGLSSSTVLIFEAAKVLGLSSDAASSWLGSLCIGMGFIGIILSSIFKMPILIAWSTAGSALLIMTLNTVSPPEAIGAFLMSAFLTFVLSITGIFEKIINHIPKALASALLAGTLLQFSINAFAQTSAHYFLIGIMLLTYIVIKKLLPQFTMLIVLLSGIIFCWLNGSLNPQSIAIKYTEFHFTWPIFTLTAFMSISLPLFMITTASQNITGLTLLRNYGFTPPISKIMSAVSFTNIFTSFFGGFTLNLSALSSAIAIGPDSHPDPQKRYCTGIVTGFLYMLIGFFAGTITSLWTAFPEQLIKAVAGFALLNTIYISLKSTFHDNSQNDAAFLTFIITASNFKLLSISSSFWGLALGLVIHAVNHSKLSFKSPQNN